jgi:hypothetical protein
MIKKDSRRFSQNSGRYLDIYRHRLFFVLPYFGIIKLFRKRKLKRLLKNVALKKYKSNIENLYNSTFRRKGSVSVVDLFYHYDYWI